MEVFDSTIFANDDDDPKNFINNYASLSQFDLDLQQQAQAAMQQGTGQDFDMFLPQLDCPNLFYNAPITPPHAFPTPSPPQRSIEQSANSNNNNTMPLFDTAFMDDTTTLYSQASSLLPPNNTMIPAVSEAENNGSSMIKQQTMPISPPLVSFDTTPVVPSQWSDPEPKPEPIGSSSPILSDNVAMSTSSPDNEQRHITPPPDLSGPPPLPLPQSTSSTTLPTQQQQQWNTSETSGMYPIFN